MKEEITNYFARAFEEMSKEKLEVIKKDAHAKLDKELDGVLLRVSLMLERSLEVQA